MAVNLIIGIDTGVNTGIAFYQQDIKQVISVKSVMIHQAMEVILQYKNSIKLVRVEDARLRKYITGGREKLQGAGSIKRDAKIWEDFLTDNNIPFELVAPKNNKTKMTSIAFAKMTGWADRTNVHARDAACLVFGWNK